MILENLYTATYYLLHRDWLRAGQYMVIYNALACVIFLVT